MKYFVFYMICCTSNLIWAFCTSYKNNNDFWFGFQIFILYVIVIYAPINTAVLAVLNRFKLGNGVISNHALMILYSTLPSVVVFFLCNLNQYVRLPLVSKYEDYLSIIVFVVMNIVIIIHARYNKGRNLHGI